MELRLTFESQSVLLEPCPKEIPIKSFKTPLTIDGYLYKPLKFIDMTAQRDKKKTFKIIFFWCVS